MLKETFISNKHLKINYIEVYNLNKWYKIRKERKGEIKMMEKVFTILLLIFSLIGLILDGSSLFEIIVVGLLFIIFISLERNTSRRLK